MRRVLGLITVVLMIVVVAAPALAGGSEHQSISAKALDDHECDSSEWHFVITQIKDEAHAPGSIEVTFSGGDVVTVPLDKFTGKTAHYTEVSHLDETVVSATADIYKKWDGQFNLSHGPCGEPEQETAFWCVDGQVVESEQEPTGESVTGPFDSEEEAAADCEEPVEPTPGTGSVVGVCLPNGSPAFEWSLTGGSEDSQANLTVEVALDFDSVDFTLFSGQIEAGQTLTGTFGDDPDEASALASGSFVRFRGSVGDAQLFDDHGDLGFYRDFNIPECEEPPVDVCPNIEGDQTTVPDGMVIDEEGNCVDEPEEPTTTTTQPEEPEDSTTTTEPEEEETTSTTAPPSTDTTEAPAPDGDAGETSKPMPWTVPAGAAMLATFVIGMSWLAWKGRTAE